MFERVEIKVLTGTKLINRFLDLHKPYAIGPIPSVFLKVFTVISVPSTTIPNFVFTYHHRHNVKIAAAGLYHVFNHLSIVSTLINLIKNQKLILASKEHIESVVKKSN